MAEPTDRKSDRLPRSGGSAVLRILRNASLLAFASLLVISLASGRLAAGLLWAGAMLVFLAPALDRKVETEGGTGAPRARTAEALRWGGLALAVAGAALLLL
jgi:hypothetical protein